MILCFRVFVLLLFAALLQVRIVKADELKAGILNFPPYYIIHENNVLTGSLYRVFKLVMDKTGMKYSISGYPPSRLYNNLRTGKVDVWLGIKGVKTYHDVVYYSRVSPGTISVKLYAHKDVALPKNLKELNNKRVLVIRGYSYGGIIDYLKNPKNRIDIYPVNDHIQAFKMLLARRMSYLIDYKLPSDWVFSKTKLSSERIHERYIKKNKLHFVVSKKTKDAKKVLSKIETAYRYLNKRGAFSK